MASTRFAGLVLAVFIVSLALKYSFACAQEAAGIASSSSHDDVSGASVANNIAGRKALREVLNRRLSKEESTRNQVLDEKTKISGDQYDSKKTSRGANQDSALEEEAQVSTEQPARPDLGPSQTHDQESFMEAADEIVKLNRGDYGAKNPAHRKPPINNHEPKN